MVGNSLNIGLYVRERIENNTGLRTYPIQADIDTPLPFAVYTRDNVSIESDKSGDFCEVASVAVAVFAGSYSDSIKYANDVRRALEVRTDVAGVVVGDYELLGTQEDVFEGGIYCQVLNYDFEVLNIKRKTEV